VLGLPLRLRCVPQSEGLPVLFVDEQIYRELPSFIVATVDKFAMLPWRGETGAFFGRVHSRIGRRFFGPMDGAVPPPQSAKLPEGLRPPDLIVQDELHLISGPLARWSGCTRQPSRACACARGPTAKWSGPRSSRPRPQCAGPTSKSRHCLGEPAWMCFRPMVSISLNPSLPLWTPARP